MKKLSIFALLVVLLSTGVQLFAQSKKAPKGFTYLFNGENFDGWYPKIRLAEDRALSEKVFCIDKENKTMHVYRDLADSTELNTGKNTTHGMIYTDKEYSRFIFKFEYKWGEKIFNNFSDFQYDAGMYYHVYDDKIWPKGIEYQVRYNHVTDQNHTGDFWASGIQWYAGDDGNFLLPKEGGKPQPKKGGEHRGRKNITYNALNDQWNQCEVIVMGDKYTIHKLNGEIVNMATDLSQSKGKIGLQSETAEIYYRNIMIKELDKDLPMKKFLK